MCKFKVGDIVVFKKGWLSFDITNDTIAQQLGGYDTEMVVTSVTCLGDAGSKHALCEIKIQTAGRNQKLYKSALSSLRFNLREMSTNSFTAVNINDILATLN